PSSASSGACETRSAEPSTPEPPRSSGGSSRGVWVSEAGVMKATRASRDAASERGHRIRYRRLPTLLSRMVGSEVLLGTPGGEDLHALDGTAAAVWTMLDRPGSVEDIANRAATVYGVSPEAITPDVEALLQSLEAQGLAAQ